jgi:glycine oxidase
VSAPVTAATAGARTDVLIVGGGVIAMSIAEALSSEGLSIRVIEADAVGSGASGAAAGMLAPIGESALDSPLLALGLESLRRFAPLCGRLREETGIDPEYEASGIFQIARRGKEVRKLLERVRAIEASARSQHWVVPPEIEWLDEPDLRDAAPHVSSEYSAAYFSPHEAHLRPPLLVRALEASARLRGARIDSGVRAHRLLLSRGRVVGVESSLGPIEAGETILAAGAWTPSILDASALGSSAFAASAIEPVRGQILTLDAPLPKMAAIAWSSDIYCVPKRDGSWIVGATEEQVGFDRRVTAEGVAWLIERARGLIPALADASFGRAWAGLRPVSADGLPIVGRDPRCEGLSIAAGHGRNGVLLSPITAQLVVDDLLGKASPAGSRPLAPRSVDPSR